MTATTTRCHRIARWAVSLGLTLLVPAAPAQSLSQAGAAEPGTQEIIDALTPRLRSLRNLGVRPREEPAGDASAAAAGPGTPPAPGAAPPTSPSASTSASASAPSAPPPSAAVAPPPPPPGISLQIGFDFDSARIRPDSMTLLARLAQALVSPELADGRFRIEGHTDARGAAAYNQRLSAARAEAVAHFLVQRGVAADRVQAVGRGSSEPANPRDPIAAENRRVHVVNLAP